MVEKKTPEVRVYYCKGCGNMFHTAKVGLKVCDKCGGTLEVINRYESKRAAGVER